MPVYVSCPHCQHPMVVSAKARGKARLCRQCGGAYKTSRVHPHALALSARSTAEMLRLAGHNDIVLLVA